MLDQRAEITQIRLWLTVLWEDALTRFRQELAIEVELNGIDVLIPAPIAVAGTDAVRQFAEFFTANIRNPNTRGAYARAIADFFDWCHTAGLNELRAL